LLSDGEEIEFGTMVWSAGLEPVNITAELDVEKSAQGRIVTDKYLRVKGQEGKVWAIGDCR
jgi:NADH dehydrogenase FAD-containing subunit